MKGPYVPLSVSYRESDKMLGCEPLAELLFVRSLAFSKEKFSQGSISDRQARLLAHDLTYYDEFAPDSLYTQLLNAGLWHQVDGGFLIDGWANWNELDASRAGTLGNHVRWHVARGIVDAACAHCLPATSTDRPESGGTSPPIAISTDQFNTKQQPPSSPPAKVRVDYSADFAAWYALYPRKAGKPEAAKAYTKARKTATADDLAHGLKRWCDQWDRENRPNDKLPYPATWLNKERWIDELNPVSNDGRAPDWGEHD